MYLSDQYKHSSRFEFKHIFLMALVPLIAVGGFLIMYGVGYIAPFAASDFNAGFAMLLFIIVGLAVPYFMVKFGVHESGFVSHQPEKDLSFSDIAKDKEVLWNEKDDNFTNPS